MATARVTANVALQPIFVTPLHEKAKIDKVTINNQGASGPITVQVEDDFTQDVSNAFTGPPAVRSAFPFDTTAPQNITYEEEQDKVCLGNVGIICSATDAGCVITIDYHFE